MMVIQTKVKHLSRMTAVLLDRLKDKIPGVRAQAAKSLSRLQQPQMKGCPVIEGRKVQFRIS